MAVKIRLKRMGKIRAPYYRIVVADSRTKRDGRSIEEIGKYHPTEEPSFIEVDSARAQYWLSVGAQPSPQVEAILKLTGDWGIFKGDKNAVSTVKTKADKTQFEADEKKRPVLKPKAAPAPIAKAEPAVAEAEPTAAKADSVVAEAAPVATAEPAVAETEPTAAKADPAVAEAEPTAAAAEPETAAVVLDGAADPERAAETDTSAAPTAPATDKA